MNRTQLELKRRALNRSQSTSALDQPQEEAGGFGDQLEAADLGGQAEAQIGRSELDELASTCSTSPSSSGPTKGERNADLKLTSGGGGDCLADRMQQTSDLMSALRQFDRSKLLSSSQSVINNSTPTANSPASTSVRPPSSSGDQMLAATKRDLIAELKESRDLDGIKRRMMESSRHKVVDLTRALAPEMATFKAEDFLDKLPGDESQAPLWKRQMLAKKAAERARKEHQEKLRLELEERRLSQVPQWKRQMLAKKAADRMRTGENSVGQPLKEQQLQQASEMPTWRRHLARLKMNASTGNLSQLVIQTPIN